VPPSLLTTTKQFKPFEDDRAGDRSPIADIIAESAGGSGEERLLSAEEKISELSRIVDAALGDRERLTRDLEDVQAEKVQMESLLRERLERMVQAEIEARLSAMRAREGGAEGGGASSLSAAAAAAAGARAAALQEQLAKAQGELAAARSALAARDAPAEDALRKLAHLRKEKEAISSIMENKISTLVDSISAGISASVPLPAGAPPPKWLRELGALDKLVKASIAALKAP
jgi:DNA repair exonuclease SbcCD ATPase subunit